MFNRGKMCLSIALKAPEVYRLSVKLMTMNQVKYILLYINISCKIKHVIKMLASANVSKSALCNLLFEWLFDYIFNDERFSVWLKMLHFITILRGLSVSLCIERFHCIPRKEIVPRCEQMSWDLIYWPSLLILSNHCLFMN